MNNSKQLLSCAISVVGTLVIAIVIWLSVGDTADGFINLVFGLDIFMLGVFFTLTAQQISTSELIANFLRGMNQPTPEITGNRVNASQMAQGRYPWETN